MFVGHLVVHIIQETLEEKKGQKHAKSEMEGDNTTNEVILYKECLRNHAASLGSYAIDGCGEFSLLLDRNHISPPPPTLHCAACGCHRSFHRKITSQEPSINPDTYNNNASVRPESSPRSGGMMTGYKKRCRTKFTDEQKEKMLDFAEKLGWRMKRREKDDDDDEVEGFCKRVGLTRKVFKVWMHNHKNSLSTTTTSAQNATSSSTQEQ